MPVLDARLLLDASPEELAFLTAVLHPPKEVRQIASHPGRTVSCRGGALPRIGGARLAGGHPLPRLESGPG